MANDPDSGHRMVWRILDGRRGHYTQVDGLTAALGDLTAVQTVDFALPGARPRIADLLLGRFPAGAGKPRPHLILAAGHRTHIPALAARRAHGGRLVVLMKPSLPLSWFDLCLIPEHDRPPTRDNVLTTHGVINTVRRSTQHDAAIGLVLLGGPSKHHDWDQDAQLRRIMHIVTSQPDMRFVVADSPRTPVATRTLLQAIEGALYLPWESTLPGEIQQRMQDAGQIWVSEDSVSMLYEALSSGAPTGLLPVPRKHETRVSRGVDRLIEDGRATTYEDWIAGSPPHAAPDFNEAARCASEILRRWPPTR